MALLGIRKKEHQKVSMFKNIFHTFYKWGWPCGRMVKLARSAAGGPVFRWFESWGRTWHCSSNHAEAASHMPQLQGPTTKNIQLCTGGLWGEKGKNKILKKKNSTSLKLQDKCTLIKCYFYFLEFCKMLVCFFFRVSTN